jgi:pimeloyl-ACP methyl ester carboxylesterase
MAIFDSLRVDVAAPADTLRLMPHGHTRQLLGGPLGSLLARPWLDGLTLRALRHVFFPLSRLWAAASAADGAHDAFWEHAGQPRRHEHRERLTRILAAFDEANVTSMATDAAWMRVFFGVAETSTATRVALETARHNRRDILNKQRRAFLPLVSRATPRVKLDILTPHDVAGLYDLKRDTDALFAPPHDLPRVDVSHPVPGIASIDSWLKFSSPSARMGDTCWARVHTPEGITNPPTVILGHGVCVDFDHWHGLLDEALALVAHGIRVIRPEAPWHGRRTPVGYFGGERAIGTVPTGMIDLFVAAIQEWGVIADWARRTSRGPLGIGGTSLGALTAQLCASVSHDWPERLKPEALYLMTHSGAMSDAMMTGAVSTLFADPAAALAKGWTPAMARRHLSMIDPVRPPVMAPSRIVSVLGSRDVITPFDGGETLVWRWGVPADNVFVSKRGHFTIPMSLIRDGTPTRRFAEILKAL